MAPHNQAALVDLARAAVEKELSSPVKLDVSTVNTEGDWAFVLAELKAADGKPFDFSKSRLADAAHEGAVSRQCAALLKQRDGRWEVLTSVIGPTDPAWLSWSTAHGAPESLFTLPD